MSFRPLDAVNDPIDPLAAASPRRAPVLAIVIPTFNEVENIPLLVEAVHNALPDVAWEIMFVDDDSPDGTAARIREIANRDTRVRLVHRFGRRGLSSACVEGIMATASPLVAVMDADLQHDERILAEMLRQHACGAADLVVGSRYVEGGSIGEWSRHRVAMSRFATQLANRLTRTPLGDPMSGFFMLDRATFLAALPRMSTVGFKILLDIAASSPTPLRVAQVPYVFRARQHGQSKLDTLVVWEYVQLLMDKAFGHIVPVRFVSFAMVGSFGVIVHFAVLTLLFKSLDVDFGVAQGIATFVATTNNFLLNNMLTYRDQRLRGARLFLGWATFNVVCLIGALANVGVARWLYAHQSYWALSALAGIAVTTVWNYTMSSVFTWRKRR